MRATGRGHGPVRQEERNDEARSDRQRSAAAVWSDVGGPDRSLGGGLPDRRQAQAQRSIPTDTYYAAINSLYNQGDYLQALKQFQEEWRGR